jgi:hypothetical protein
LAPPDYHLASSNQTLSLLGIMPERRLRPSVGRSRRVLIRHARVKGKPDVAVP